MKPVRPGIDVFYRSGWERRGRDHFCPPSVQTAIGSHFKVRAGHSYYHFGRAHAHQALADTISHFVRKAKPVALEEGEVATFSVGKIGGGSAINAIPQQSWFEIDLRSIDP